MFIRGAKKEVSFESKMAAVLVPKLLHGSYKEL